MTKTKLLLTGLLAGAVAVGTACKTDQGATTGTDTTTAPNQTPPPPPSTDTDTGGSGYDNPERGQDVNPLPDEGTREREPGVHQGDTHAPAGNPGLEPGPLGEERDLSNETGEEPNNPGSQSPQPINDNPESGEDGTSQQPPQ